jgi:membrane protease subunit (stomatin/prohibitin family)
MEFSEALTPELSKMLGEYGLQLVDFSLEKLEVDNTTPERQKYIDRINAAEINASSIGMSYDYIVQRELQKDAVNNPGGIAAAGAGLGMGLGMGGAFAAMGANAYTTPHPMGFAGQQPNPMQQQMQMQQQQMQQQAAAPQADPMEVLTKMKQMLDAGLITQQQYDAKVAEVMSRM